ncbi:response regulator [Rhodovarius crocodyli]|uniref:Response regulator n=1 Tax=Rhodovarius crocodyli TaxID=1979269 RepID=A0A437MFD8_9PROT|nr:response regulator [Rhodovarius crocodyli]RVT96343.1 response regulator [Rhodovarius crocodyli]
MSLNAIRVLVVEDEPLVAMLLEDALLDAGAEVLGPVGTVADALAMLEQLPDVALLDLRLGRDSAVPVADDMVVRGIPFAVMSGDVGGNLPVRHHPAPALAKPFSPDEAIRLLESIVARA